MRISSFPLWDLQIGKQFLVGLMQEWKSKVKSTQSYVDEFSKKYRDYRLQGKLDYKINWKETDLKSVLFWPLDNMGRARLRSHEILTLCYLVLFLNTLCMSWECSSVVDHLLAPYVQDPDCDPKYCKGGEAREGKEEAAKEEHN